MKRLKMFLTGLLLVFASTLYAQTEISGTVTDDAGEPIIGASVVEKGTTNGTITDLDGNFQLSVENGKTLVVSYIGYMSVEVSAGDNLKITLKEDLAEIDEIVVTGYSVQKKSDLTGAVSVVKTDDIAKQNENNPLKAMQGRVPGMNISADGSPSGSATVRIRGIGTLNNNDPL
ncbi:MAG: carboxypeptidase-like regulatory domain-containing protein, partial [Bacteroidales bacterium]|nr:carboxypeptidase-like regulatory domain-containing protein [Bacteroidales bacterium]